MANDFSALTQREKIAYWTFEPSPGVFESGLQDEWNNFRLMQTLAHYENISFPSSTHNNNQDGGSYSIECVNRNLGTENYLYMLSTKQFEIFPGSSWGSGWQNSDFTVGMAFYPHSLNPSATYLDGAYLIGMNTAWGIYFNSRGNLTFYVGSKEATVLSALAANVWHFVVASYTSAGNIKVSVYQYPGDRNDATNTGASLTNVNSYFCVGSVSYGWPYYRAFDGLIDHVFILGKAITSNSEIDALEAGTYGS